MNCSSFEDLLEQYFENTLLPREAASMKLHLDRCAACAALFEEVRVVDALLLTPQKTEPRANFTFAVMAEARAMHAPTRKRTPFVAYLVSYLALAWIVIGGAFFFANDAVTAMLGTTLTSARHFGAMLDTIVRIPLATFRSLGAIAGAVLACDIAIAGFAVAYGTRRSRLIRERDARS